MRDYINSGEGFWTEKNNPTKCILGIPEEVEEERIEDWKEKSLIEERKYNFRKAKASNLINEVGKRDINFKIYILKKLGYKSVKTRRGAVNFSEIREVDYPNLERFYEITISGLRKIRDNPNQENDLVKRLDLSQ